MSKIAFISGANRGIGFATAEALAAQGITVVMGCRDVNKGQQAASKLSQQGYQVEAIAYDANQADSADQVYDFLQKKYGVLDILINNAGILQEDLVGNNSSVSVSQQVLQQTFQTNLFAVVDLTQKLLPLLMQSTAGRVVNLSSIVGSLNIHSMENSPIAPAKAFAYNASKTALNAFTVHLADALKSTNIKVNSAHPGWIKTELGGPHAPMELSESFKTSLRLATLDQHGPTGGFFHEADTLPW